MARYPHKPDLTQRKTGHITNERTAWVTLSKLEAVVFIGDAEEYLEKAPYRPDGYHQVKLILRLPSRKMPWILNLTNMTVNELDELKKCIDYGFENARPICVDLDKRAQEAFDNGDDSWSRLYRPDAIFIVRGEGEPINYQRLSPKDGDEWVQSEHAESVPDGPVECLDVGKGELPLPTGSGDGTGPGSENGTEGGLGGEDSQS